MVSLEPNREAEAAELAAPLLLESADFGYSDPEQEPEAPAMTPAQEAEFEAAADHCWPDRTREQPGTCRDCGGRAAAPHSHICRDCLHQRGV